MDGNDMYIKHIRKYGMIAAGFLLLACILVGCSEKKEEVFPSTTMDIPYIGSDPEITTSCTIDIVNSWTAFMDNPYIWVCDQNQYFVFGVTSKTFESFDKFQSDFLETAGSGWSIKEAPSIFSIKNSQFDYVLYAEYNKDRIVNFLMLDDNGLVWYIEFCYVQDADNADEIIDQAKQMIFSFNFTK